MINFKKFLKSVNDKFNSKSYLGFLQNNLPVSSTNWSSVNFLNANETSLYVNRAIAKRSEKVSETEFVLKDKKGNAIENDYLLDLLYKPNDVFTGRQFWGLYQKYYDLVGEVFILVETEGSELFSKDKRKKIKGLHLLIPTNVTIEFNKKGGVIKYIYQAQDGQITYKPEQIIYIFNPNPKSPLRGQSLLKAGVSSIQTEIQINTYHSRVLENGGKVEGVFKFKAGELTEEQLKDVKTRYQKEYGSAKKSGLPLFLGGDADYIKTGLTPDELSFLEAKKMTLEDICILTGVPKAVLGSTNNEKYSNADTAYRIFLRETIKPLLEQLTTSLDEMLFPDDRCLTFVDPTPENIDEKIKVTESGIKNHYMTTNEARERHGLDPVNDGDDILIPMNLITLGKQDEDFKKSEQKKKDAVINPNSDHDTRRIWWELQINRMEKREVVFLKTLKKYLTEQKNRIIKQFKNGKDYFKKELVDEIFDINLEIGIGKDIFNEVLFVMLVDAGVDAKSIIGNDYKFYLTAEMTSWLDNREDIFLRQINETTFQELKKQFAESLDAGESRDKLIKRVQDTYKDINKNRAKTIARTEVHNITQYGTIEGYKQGGLTTKIWVSVLGPKTRDTHRAIDGQERPINTPFSNGLMYPGDTNGPASEVINCRCTI